MKIKIEFTVEIAESRMIALAKIYPTMNEKQLKEMLLGGIKDGVLKISPSPDINVKFVSLSEIIENEIQTPT